MPNRYGEPDAIDELNEHIRQHEEALRAIDFAVNVFGSKGAINVIIDHYMCRMAADSVPPAPSGEEPF